jgi:archaellum component FlaC
MCSHVVDKDTERQAEAPTLQEKTDVAYKKQVETPADPRNIENINSILEKYPTVKNALLKGECLKQKGKTMESHRVFSGAMNDIFRIIENRKIRDEMSWKGQNGNAKDYEEELETIQKYIDEKIRSLYDEKLIPIGKDKN